MSLFLSLWRVFQGALIGIGAILPGISGGVMCVLFGIYRPMMQLLEKPVSTFRRSWRLFLPILLGWVGGAWAFSFVLDHLFSQGFLQVCAVWVFIGLLCGTLPALWKTATVKGFGKSELISLVVSFVLSLFFFLLFSATETVFHFSEALSVTLLTMFCSGVGWGISLIVPGLSFAGILMFFGLYQQWNTGVKELDPIVLVPWILGIVVVVLFCTRPVNRLFEKHYGVAYQALFGIMLSSAIAIVPFGNITLDSGAIYPVEYSLHTVWIYLVCFAAGFAVALGMDRFSEKFGLNAPKE